MGISTTFPRCSQRSQRASSSQPWDLACFSPGTARSRTVGAGAAAGAGRHGQHHWNFSRDPDSPTVNLDDADDESISSSGTSQWDDGSEEDTMQSSVPHNMPKFKYDEFPFFQQAAYKALVNLQNHKEYSKGSFPITHTLNILHTMPVPSSSFVAWHKEQLPTLEQEAEAWLAVRTPWRCSTVRPSWTSTSINSRGTSSQRFSAARWRSTFPFGRSQTRQNCTSGKYTSYLTITS
ncbi:hypothetical protein Vretifemale_1564 [Volvox reticuliferus]|uniref:Uncharacterized protein n=1 Tax=Volvox reticuliferus TaxID=1737510 RepID=A0A8J4FHC8_9CHLO|nr:hypothetical protein Vretifemale_1564 [Volvox reticuliferus]